MHLPDRVVPRRGTPFDNPTGTRYSRRTTTKTLLQNSR